MGHRIPPGEEAAALRDLISEARAAARELRTEIRAADRLAPTLISHFGDVHAREIKQLSNYFTEESNRHAASLNADVERAREMINNQIMTGRAVFDRDTMTVSITWGSGGFDADASLPYPEETPKEKTQ